MHDAPHVPPAEPEETGPKLRPCDPLAVALANVSLLGIGYAMLGRWAFAAGNALITLVLLAFLGSVERPEWWQAGVLLWWLAVVGHGWLLARGQHRRSGRSVSVGEQRVIAGAIAAVMLATLGFLRVDAWRIESDAAAAHRAGECTRAVSALDDLWFAHRLADAPLLRRAEDTVAACETLLRARRQASEDRLLAAETLKRYGAHPSARWQGAEQWRADLLIAEAAQELYRALHGEAGQLEAGFVHLATVVEEIPGRESHAGEVVDDFVTALPAAEACVTATITDWLTGRPTRGNALDRAVSAVPQLAPDAIVGCGDDLLSGDQPSKALGRYQQLVNEYPEHALTARAQAGITRARQAIQLREVRSLLDTYSGALPAYCDDPASYSAAAPYQGRGPHPTLLFGQDGHRSRLPAAWRAHDAADAVLVICAGESKLGTPVQTCTYHAPGALLKYHSVTFHKRKIPVRVYEVRTGKLVKRTSVEISGNSCPRFIRYKYYISDLGPPSHMYVRGSSAADIRAAYQRLIDP